MPLVYSVGMALIKLDGVKKQLLENGKYWIVFTGDSIASCEWVHPNWRDIVIYVLQTELTELMGGEWKLPEWGIKGFNFAYDGATTKDVRDRMDDVLLVKPQLIIGLMGGNDPALGIGVEESVENIKQIANAVEKSGSNLVWSNSIPAKSGDKKNEEYEPYAKALMDIEDMDRFIKLDMFNLYQKYPTDRFFTFLSEENPVEGLKEGDLDPQHPNQLGNAYIAKIILGEVFGVDFDAEKYIDETLRGEKFPGY